MIGELYDQKLVNLDMAAPVSLCFCALSYSRAATSVVLYYMMVIMMMMIYR